MADLRLAGQLAVMLALRERDATWLDRARGDLRRAFRAPAMPGACEAALSLARLEALHAVDPRAAYLEAFRTSRRFPPSTDDNRACVAEAARILAILEGFKPDPELLAVIESDPGADLDTSELATDLEAWVSRQSNESSAVLERINVYGEPGQVPGSAAGVRIVLRLDHLTRFSKGQLPAEGNLPHRFYVDLAGASLGPGLRPMTPVGRAGVARVRVANFQPGVVRVVFDMAEGTRHGLFLLSEPYRLVIDFEHDSAAVAAPDSRDRPHIVVIDPGHGGNDYGARYEGMKEAILTLDIARRAVVLLTRRLPGARVLLTRHSDEPVSLEQRVAFANAVRADVFVSIHLNAADELVAHGGVATFVLDTTDDEQAMRLAARENGTRVADVTGLQRILASLHRQEQVAESRVLADLVHLGTLAAARRRLPNLPDRGVKSAMFYVLVGARMPAVLLEASFLTQPEEARALGTVEYRQHLAVGIAEGIARYVRRQR